MALIPSAYLAFAWDSDLKCWILTWRSRGSAPRRSVVHTHVELDPATASRLLSVIQAEMESWLL